jgi:hypothetical protein
MDLGLHRALHLCVRPRDPVRLAHHLRSARSAVFTGQPVVYSHVSDYRILGTLYNFLFIIASTMLLLNLIIALLTSAYAEASNQSGDTLAERQYDTLKLNLVSLVSWRTHARCSAPSVLTNR